MRQSAQEEVMSYALSLHVYLRDVLTVRLMFHCDRHHALRG